MNKSAQIGPEAHPEASRPQVRAALVDDVPAVAEAVRELLVELGGTPPAAVAMEAAARTVIEDGDAGAVFVADAAGTVVGVLAASWPLAIHGGGTYGLIQDLWVAPTWRSRAVGVELLSAFVALASTRTVSRIEVGIPRDGFPALEATRRFYDANGFSMVGARMRRSAE
ncbi:MAG: Branched-chain-amino-acid transaminase [Frankiales bacterium]|nr:Branched-chain-amino-acid transaminase [Frankiales bacterium]